MFGKLLESEWDILDQQNMQFHKDAVKSPAATKEILLEFFPGRIK